MSGLTEDQMETLLARREAGKFLKQMEKAGGELYRGSRLEPRGTSQTYAEMGIDKKDAYRWQTEAEVPDIEDLYHVVDEIYKLLKEDKE